MPHPCSLDKNKPGTEYMPNNLGGQETGYGCIHAARAGDRLDNHKCLFDSNMGATSCRMD